MADLYDGWTHELNRKEAFERLDYWFEHIAEPRAIGVIKLLVLALKIELTGQEHVETLGGN
jgi:hypothetical protein